MKNLLSNDYVVLGARIVLGFAFLVASVDKLASPELFARSIINYKILPHDPAMVIATILPWAEMLCSLCLIFGLATRGGSLLMGAMLFVFTVAVLSALARGLDITCGCFTQDPAAGKVGWMKLGENTLLLLVSVFIYLSSGVRFTLERYLHNQRGQSAV